MARVASPASAPRAPDASPAPAPREWSGAGLLRGAALHFGRLFAVPIALATLWYLAVALGVFPERLLPSPTTVFGEAFPRLLTRPDMLETLLASVSRVFRGWLWASLVGVPLGLMAGLSWRWRLILQGPVNAGRSMPVAAIVPLAILWFGTGDRPAIFLVFIVAVWPILVNTMGGVQNVSKVQRDASLTMGANQLQVLYTVVIPAALGSILVGLRLGIGFAWMAVVLSELVGVKTGLGAFLLQLRQVSDTPGMFAIIITIGAMGLLSDALFRWMTRRYTRWQTR
jgi:ABC-type nitrate/sulfonate/bicarbonate transport system permease component